MELSSVARPSSPAGNWFCTALAVVLVAATALLASPGFAQEAATTAADAAAATPAVPAAPAPAAEAATEGGGLNAIAIRNIIIVVALFVIPIILGSVMAKSMKMTDYGWKFALAIGTLSAAVALVVFGQIKLGPDLSGGITLIYEIERKESSDLNAPQAEKPPADEQNLAEEDAELTEEGAEEVAEDEANPEAEQQGFAGLNRSDTMAALIKALMERIDPAGTKEVSIKKFGDDQIEIIIPKAEKAELEAIERRIYTAGVLEFRITASRQFDQHRAIIELAERLPANQNLVRIDGKEVARWVEYDAKQFGDAENAGRMLVVRTTSKVPQALVLTNDGLNVTGEFLRSASPDNDQTGRPAVTFVFNSQGAFRFERLTRAHQPSPSGAKYNLGILLDNRLLSAPNLNAVISDRGIIEGLDDQAEVDFLVGILNAGSLPASLNKEPISRAQISPTLGSQTIERGKLAMALTMAMVAVFMIGYYRFAGLVAVFAVVANLLLLVAMMVLIKGAFTMPGLAGLVLTIGMAVDSNVLIYERIREELQRGAALRMAIRNGYARAWITIFDSHVTTIMTGVVLYKIAPDSVKGFGVTLVLGIFINLFTSVFMTRIIFDVAERRGWIKKLSMAQWIREPNVDFVGLQRICITASLIAVGLGIAAIYSRGRDLLDIDFTGGSSVEMVLKDDHKMDYVEVQNTISETPLAGSTLVEMDNSRKRYTLTTINDNVLEVEEILNDAFKGKLETYHVEISDIQAIPGEPSSTSSSSLLRLPSMRLASLSGPLSMMGLLQDAGDQEAEPAAEEPAAPAAETEAQETPAAETPATETPAEPPAEAEEMTAAPETAAETPATSEPAAAEEPAATEPAAEQPASTTPAATEPAAEEGADESFAGGTSAHLRFGAADKDTGGVDYAVLEHIMSDALKSAGHEDVAFSISNPDYQTGSIRNFNDWDVKIALPESDARAVFDQLNTRFNDQPVFPLSNKIGGRVANQMAVQAVAATVLCMIGLIGFLWFRFNGVMYGIAAIVALLFDIVIVIGAVAASAYIVDWAPGLASALLIDKFKLDLTLVAALLTLVGYCINDTIVVFDRIREVKGKSPLLTGEMINQSINQTLSRTLLTGLLTIGSVVVLYLVAGEGIHGFAFSLFIGFIVGTFGSIFIASPVLLWLTERTEGAALRAKAQAA